MRKRKREEDKLNVNEVEIVRNLFQAGDTRSMIAIKLGISKGTIFRRDASLEVDRLIEKAVFITAENQNEVLEYAKSIEKIFGGLTMDVLRNIINGSAILKKLPIPLPDPLQKNVINWLNQFMVRNNIALRGVGVSKYSLNKSDSLFYSNIHEIVTSYDIKRSNIYNMGTYDLLSKMSVAKIVKKSITSMFCISTTGENVIPSIIAIDKYLNDYINKKYLKFYSRYGFVTTEIFLEWLVHFQKHSNSSESNPVLLIVENHINFISLDVFLFCQSNHIHLLAVPFESVTHSVNCFEPLEYLFAKVSVVYQDMLDIPLDKALELIIEKYENVATVENIIDGFKWAGIYPLKYGNAIEEVILEDIKQEHIKTEKIEVEEEVFTDPNVTTTSINTEPKNKASNDVELSLRGQSYNSTVFPSMDASVTKRQPQLPALEQLQTCSSSSPVSIPTTTSSIKSKPDINYLKAQYQLQTDQRKRKREEEILTGDEVEIVRNLLVAGYARTKIASKLGYIKGNMFTSEATMEVDRLIEEAVFVTAENQNEVLEYAWGIEKIFGGLTTDGLRNIINGNATLKKLPIPLPDLVQKNVINWLNQFMVRNNIAFRGVGVSKNSLNKSDSLFYSNIHEIVTSYDIKRSNIYNMGTYDLLSKMSVAKIIKKSITSMFCISATGENVIPSIIAIDKYLNDYINKKYLKFYSRYGFVTTEIFLEWLIHFQKHSNSSQSNPVLLIVENHINFISLDVFLFCQSNHIHLLAVPFESVTHSVNYFEPLEYLFAKVSVVYQDMLDIPLGKALELIIEKYENVATVENIIDGFKWAGIYPLKYGNAIEEVILEDIKQEHIIKTEKIEVKEEVFTDQNIPTTSINTEPKDKSLNDLELIGCRQNYSTPVFPSMDASVIKSSELTALKQFETSHGSNSPVFTPTIASSIKKEHEFKLSDQDQSITNQSNSTPIFLATDDSNIKIEPEFIGLNVEDQYEVDQNYSTPVFNPVNASVIKTEECTDLTIMKQIDSSQGSSSCAFILMDPAGINVNVQDQSQTNQNFNSPVFLSTNSSSIIIESDCDDSNSVEIIEGDLIKFDSHIVTQDVKYLDQVKQLLKEPKEIFLPETQEDFQDENEDEQMFVNQREVKNYPSSNCDRFLSSFINTFNEKDKVKVNSIENCVGQSYSHQISSTPTVSSAVEDLEDVLPSAIIPIPPPAFRSAWD